MVVHAEALGGSGASVTSALGVITIVLAGLSRVAIMMRRNRRGDASARWPGPASGGGPGAAYGQPRRPPAADDQHEQDPAYWETEPPEGSLPADGVIGDDPKPDQGPGQPAPS
jgi:hypothetical protein